jgi:hypothetical protein
LPPRESRTTVSRKQHWPAERGLADRYSSQLGKRGKFSTTLAPRVVTTVKNRKIEMIDLRFTDLPGLWLGIPIDV